LKSHGYQNPIKRKDTNLKIIGRMVLDIINIIEQNPYENKSIRITKKHQPSKGEKGHSKSEKGELVGRLLRGKLQTKGFQQ
jgi:hypothetical protein